MGISAAANSENPPAAPQMPSTENNGSSMIIIDWNIAYLNSPEPKLEFLEEKIDKQPYIIILQEVIPSAFEAIKKHFEKTAQVEYSLNYRVPGKYDNRSRKLGIVIIMSQDFHIESAGVLERALLPDRTLFVEASRNGDPIRILGLHSITGCEHKKAKELQFYSFAEGIDMLKPDIVGIDANEPKIDHYDISRMEFFDNHLHGDGCRTFFSVMQENKLKDCFAMHYNQDDYIEGIPLTTSHIIQRGSKHVRYDFLFANHEKLGDFRCIYEYEQATRAGSDHAAIVLENS